MLSSSKVGKGARQHEKNGPQNTRGVIAISKFSWVGNKRVINSKYQ